MTSTKIIAPADPTPAEMNARADALRAQFANVAPTPAVKIDLPDYTAGKRSVQVLFKMITDALTAGVPHQQIIDLYEASAEQLSRNPNTKTKSVCRDLAALTAAAQS